jgi:hypothetical protein
MASTTTSVHLPSASRRAECANSHQHGHHAHLRLSMLQRRTPPEQRTPLHHAPSRYVSLPLASSFPCFSLSSSPSPYVRLRSDRPTLTVSLALLLPSSPPLSLARLVLSLLSILPSASPGLRLQGNDEGIGINCQTVPCRERGSRDTPERPRRVGSVPQAVHTRAISSVRPMSLVLNSARRRRGQREHRDSAQRARRSSWRGLASDVEPETPQVKLVSASAKAARRRLAAPDDPRLAKTPLMLFLVSLAPPTCRSLSRASSCDSATCAGLRAAPDGQRIERWDASTRAVHPLVPSKARCESEQGRASQLTSPHE